MKTTNHLVHTPSVVLAADYSYCMQLIGLDGSPMHPLLRITALDAKGVVERWREGKHITIPGQTASMTEDGKKIILGGGEVIVGTWHFIRADQVASIRFSQPEPLPEG